MNSCRRVASWLGVLCLSATALFAQGQKQQRSGAEYWFKIEKEMGLQTRYSVDMEIQAMGMVMPSKTYRLDKLTRSETTMPIFNMRMVALEVVENGKPVSYTLFPDKKKYCLNDAAEDETGKAPEFKVTEAGTEVYEGVTCKKRHISMTVKDGPAQEMDMLFSPAQKNMPVKMTATAKIETEPGQPPMEMTSVVLFKNYVFAAPDAALFTIPKDYVKAADMNEIMLGGLGGLTAPSQSGQTGAAAGQPNLADLLRQAQAEEAKEAQAEARQEAQEKAATAPNQNLQQGLQTLRGLFGK